MAVILNDIGEEDNKSVVHTWYFGEVTSVSQRRRSEEMVVNYTADIKWDLGGINTRQVLSEDIFAGPDNTLGLNSWMQA